MLYPLYVHLGDKKHAHGVTFPDFPGCFSAADEIEDLPAAVQEAFEAHFYDSGEAIPSPSPIEELIQNPEYHGGVWMLFDLDLSKVTSKAIRLNISLPERLVQLIDAEARARRLSRSAFLALAAEHEMAHT